MKFQSNLTKFYSTNSSNQKDLLNTNSLIENSNFSNENNLSDLQISDLQTSNVRDIKNPNYLYFLGGFAEGEGSNTVSITVNKNFKYGVSIKPEFNVAQHKNGIETLKSFVELFGAGTVVLKSGSDDVYVYVVKGIKIMIDKVIPFLITYVQPFSGKKKEYELFSKIVHMSAEGAQSNKENLIEMINLIYEFDKNKLGKGKARKRELNEILEIINDKDTYFGSKSN